eukprot:TRINITY_DN9688_c0_g1_i4.p2 TRINITY_DN9688_c0_g1~~TRINITY_DN9688_c0_g1_i4.p2  ORF type:complete len:135 (-),score=14.96 TRINITY_DN9688_c0_g1_i4:153-509(-)
MCIRDSSEITPSIEKPNYVPSRKPNTQTSLNYAIDDFDDLNDTPQNKGKKTQTLVEPPKINVSNSPIRPNKIRLSGSEDDLETINLRQKHFLLSFEGFCLLIFVSPTLSVCLFAILRF